MPKKTGKAQDQSPPEAKGGYKDNLDALKAVVDQLETGELEIEEAMKKYEKGIASYRRCRKLLDEAERKIEILARDDEGNLKASDAGEEFEIAPQDE